MAIIQDRDRNDLYREWAERAEAGTVAPHEGREIDLVLQGTKPFATVEQRKQPDAFQEARNLVIAGHLTGRIRCGEEGWEVCFALPGEAGEAAVARYEWLLANGVRELGIKQYHREMGALFGYSPADIEAFIAADVHCDCSKCRGA